MPTTRTSRTSRPGRLFKDAAAYKLMRATMTHDPSIRPALRRLLKMGAYNIRPDYKLVRGTGSRYDRVPDPEAWNADLDAFGRKNAMGVGMLKGRDGKWFFHEQ